MSTRAKRIPKGTEVSREAKSGRFVVKKASKSQIVQALSDLGVAPKDATGANRIVFILERDKGKASTYTPPKEPTMKSSGAGPDESVRKAEIIAHATEALDGQTNALHWLQQPHRSLGGRAPLDLLSRGSAEEAEQVDELLYGLEYGIYA
jgi:uncharacterized protein (DUF2384 family)